MAMQSLRAAGCVALLLTMVGCGATVSKSSAPAADTTNSAVRPSMDPSSISVLVTFVGGPADGQTQQLPLNQLGDGITVSGVTYRTALGLAPEVKDTDQGLAQVFRPE